MVKERFTNFGHEIKKNRALFLMVLPAVLLVLAGSVNGLILPITLLTILCASRRKDIVGDHYKHPAILIVLGVLVVLLTGYSGIKALPQILTIFG